MAEIKVEMSIYKQREADSKSYGFSTPSFSVPRHKPMFIPNRSLDGFVFGKMPIQHRGTMPSKPAPIRRTESPKGAAPNSRRRGRRRTTNLRNTIVQGRASSKGANIGVPNRQLCFYRWASPSGAFLSVLGGQNGRKCSNDRLGLS